MALAAGALTTLLVLAVIASAFAADFLPSSLLPHKPTRLRPPSLSPHIRGGQSLCLRGGGVEEDALERLEANLKLLSTKCDEMEKQFGAGQDEDVMGYTRKGMPMSFHPQNAEMVEEGEYDSEEFAGKPKQGAWEPREEDLKAGMEMAEWMEDVVEKMSPENILKGIKEMGASPDDLEPVMNKRGTEMGSIEAFDKSREKLRRTLEEVKGTHALLRQSMSQRSPTEELTDEIAQMGEEEINPYVKLLHEWARQSQHEHESGAFAAQHKAATAPHLTVEGRRAEKRPPQALKQQQEEAVAAEAPATSP